MCGQNIKIVSTKPQMLPLICIKGCSDDIYFYIQKLCLYVNLFLKVCEIFLIISYSRSNFISRIYIVCYWSIKKWSINGTKFQIPCKIDTLQNINYSLWPFIIAFATACFFFIFDNINQFTFWTFDNWIKTFPSCSMLGSTLLFTCMYIIFHGKTLKFWNTSWNKKWTTDYANTLNHRKIKIWCTCMYMMYS